MAVTLRKWLDFKSFFQGLFFTPGKTTYTSTHWKILKTNKHGGAEWPLGCSVPFPATDCHTHKQRHRQLSSSLALWIVPIPVSLSTAAATNYLLQLETQTGWGGSVQVWAGPKHNPWAQKNQSEEEKFWLAFLYLTGITNIDGQI